MMLTFNLLNEINTEVGDQEYLLEIPPSEMIYMGYIIESLEGWAFHTIVDKEKHILYISVIKDYVSDFKLLLEKLKN